MEGTLQITRDRLDCSQLKRQPRSAPLTTHPFVYVVTAEPYKCVPNKKEIQLKFSKLKFESLVLSRRATGLDVNSPNQERSVGVTLRPAVKDAGHRPGPVPTRLSPPAKRVSGWSLVSPARKLNLREAGSLSHAAHGWCAHSRHTRI